MSTVQQFSKRAERQRCIREGVRFMLGRQSDEHASMLASKPIRIICATCAAVNLFGMVSLDPGSVQAKRCVFVNYARCK